MSVKKNIAYFFEESSLVYPSFFSLLKSQVAQESLFVDQHIDERIQDLYKSDQYMDAYTLQTVLEITKQLKIHNEIETDSLLDFSRIELLLNKYKEVYFISQKRNIISRIPHALAIQKGFKAGMIKGSSFEWIDISEPNKKTFTEAFYLDDPDFIKPTPLQSVNTVYTEKYGYLTLDKSRNYSGGEGVIYPTFNGFMVKLYDEKHQTYSNAKKIQRMVELDVYNPSIIWPLDIAYFNGHFLGYIMKEIKGVISLNDEFDTSTKRIRSHPYYRVLALLNVMKPIDYLHKKNILVSDLKDSNILIRDEKNIFIVDSGSFQVEDYASTVLTAGWVDDTFDKDFDAKRQLRQIEDEYYAIFRIAFEILIGKSPHFNPQDTELDAMNTKSFHFSQRPSFGDTNSLRNYEKLWAVYSQKIRDYFYYFYSDYKARKITYLETFILELEKELLRFKPYAQN
jgi:serine/threonine protein kinase